MSIISGCVYYTKRKTKSVVSGMDHLGRSCSNWNTLRLSHASFRFIVLCIKSLRNFELRLWDMIFIETVVEVWWVQLVYWDTDLCIGTRQFLKITFQGLLIIPELSFSVVMMIMAMCILTFIYKHYLGNEEKTLSNSISSELLSLKLSLFKQRKFPVC